jgi:hypothetical protein
MSSLFLHGGGDDPEWRAATFGRFLSSLDTARTGPLVLVVAEDSEAGAQESYAAYESIFASLGSGVAFAPLLVAPASPLTVGDWRR